MRCCYWYVSTTEPVSAGFGSFIAVLYLDFIFKANT